MQTSLIGTRYCLLYFLLSIFPRLNAQISRTAVKLPVTTTASAVIAFRVAGTFIGGEPLANNTEQKVNFTGAYFDENKNFSIINDEFVAPSDGVYHFDLRVNWLQFTAPGMVSLFIRTNLYEQIAMTSVQQSSATQIFDSNFATLMKLKTGDKITVHILQKSGVQQKYQQVVFDGFKVN